VPHHRSVPGANAPSACDGHRRRQRHTSRQPILMLGPITWLFFSPPPRFRPPMGEGKSVNTAHWKGYQADHAIRHGGVGARHFDASGPVVRRAFESFPRQDLPVEASKRASGPDGQKRVSVRSLTIHCRVGSSRGQQQEAANSRFARQSDARARLWSPKTPACAAGLQPYTPSSAYHRILQNRSVPTIFRNDGRTSSPARRPRDDFSTGKMAFTFRATTST